MKWKNIALDSNIFFITATITEWQPLLACDQVRRILLDDFQYYRSKYASRIVGYVIMPEHYHILLELSNPEDLPCWLHDVQRHTALEILKWLRDTHDPSEVEVFRRHANGESKLAIWKEQARSLPIVSERVLKIKLEYIHNNPIKRGLVDDPAEWPWSSWRNYCHNDDSIFRVDRLILP